MNTTVQPNSVVQSLATRLRVAESHVATVLAKEMERLRAESRIHSFVVVLATRQTRKRLQAEQIAEEIAARTRMPSAADSALLLSLARTLER